MTTPLVPFQLLFFGACQIVFSDSALYDKFSLWECDNWCKSGNMEPRQQCINSVWKTLVHWPSDIRYNDFKRQLKTYLFLIDLNAAQHSDVHLFLIALQK